jgi:hypothetical protein
LIKKCKACGGVIDDPRLIVCPHCDKSLTESISETLELSRDQENHIVTMLWHRLWRRTLKWVGWGITILVFFTGVSLLGIYFKVTRYLETTLVTNISEQFQTPKIKNTVEEVAKNEANEILIKQVNPEVEQFKSQTGEKVKKFEDFLVELKHQYEKDYQILSNEIAKLKKRNEIAQLGDKGVLEASRDSLEELERMVENVESADIKTAAAAEIARIKIFWTGATKIKGIPLTLYGVKLSELKTKALIDDLLNNNDWVVNALAAQELGNRKEKGVSEALLQCIDKNRNLEVVRDALRSFEKVTGFDSPDVFGRDLTDKWWKEHSDEVNPKMKSPE